jgi:hypothetical protein
LNATVLFSTLLKEKEVVAITLEATDKQHPILCPMSPAAESQMMPDSALIDNEAVADAVNCWSRNHASWSCSALQSLYFYKKLKHLTYNYITYTDIFEEPSQFLGKEINQVCISSMRDVHPVIYYYENN